jgi:methionyl-tRNA formyltransferase
MKIVFMGTPEFARHPLEYIHKSPRHEILAVVTGRDKRSGRGRRFSATPVKACAEELGYPVLTPKSLKSKDFHEEIKKIDADLYVVVAFRILPKELFTIPPQGSINLHGSLLPKYRGAAPINWALINGEKETGLTTFFLREKVDTGNVIYQEKVEIGPEETFDELYLRMAKLAGPVIEKTLDMIESGDFEVKTQDNSKATPAPKLSPFDALIDWGLPSENVVNFIRGASSIPGAYTFYRGKRLKILRAKKTDFNGQKELRPGQIIEDKNRLLVATSDGAVELTEVQPEGKGRMPGEAFLRGYRPDSSIILGEKIKQGLKNL